MSDDQRIMNIKYIYYLISVKTIKFISSIHTCAVDFTNYIEELNKTKMLEMVLHNRSIALYYWVANEVAIAYTSLSISKCFILEGKFGKINSQSKRNKSK